MARLDTWSTTAASNNSAAPDGYPEGMKASDFNNGMRETMAQVRTAWEENDWRNFYGATTATYQSATTFDIDDEYQAQFTVGRRFRAGIPDGTWVYGRVVSESTSVGVTTVTVAMDTGDAIDANLDTIYLARDVRSIGPGAGVLDTVPGSLSAPGLIFGGVADVGFYSPGSTSMAGVADGAVQFVLAGTEDYNFRVAAPFFLADTPITTGGAFESHSFHAAQPMAWLQKGVSGSAWTPGTAAEFILESDASISMGIVTPADETGSLFFGDAADEDVGGFTYTHATNALVARTAGATAWTADADGDLIVTGTVNAADGSAAQPAFEASTDPGTGMYYEPLSGGAYPSLRHSLGGIPLLALEYLGQLDATSHELWVAPGGVAAKTRISGGQDAGAIMFEVRPYHSGNTMRVSGGGDAGENTSPFIDQFGMDHASRAGDIDITVGTGGAIAIVGGVTCSSSMSVGGSFDSAGSTFDISLGSGDDTLSWDTANGVLNIEPGLHIKSLATYANTNGNQPETDGNMYITDSGTIWRSTSSRRYKENITDVPDVEGMNAVRSLRAVRYNRIGNRHPALGFIAEDVHAAVPESKFLADDYNGRALMGMVLAAVRDVDARLTDLETP